MATQSKENMVAAIREYLDRAQGRVSSSIFPTFPVWIPAVDTALSKDEQMVPMKAKPVPGTLSPVVTITNPGSDYTGPPTFSLQTTGGGTGTAFSAVITNGSIDTVHKPFPDVLGFTDHPMAPLVEWPN
jgi:hypothetical protein